MHEHLRWVSSARLSGIRPRKSVSGVPRSRATDNGTIARFTAQKRAVLACEAEDINSDGTVNVLDLIDLLLAFGAACP